MVRAPALTLLALLGVGAQAAAFKAVLLVPQDDPRLERARVERAYLGHPTGPATEAVAVALKEARLELEAVGASLTVDTVPVGDAAAARAAAQKAEKAGAVALLADLPADTLLAAVDAVRLPVLNLSAADDRLRGPDCRAHLLHVAPSERMRADALAQTLVARKWSQVLLLTGPGPQDTTRSAAAQAALKRYGLKLAGAKPYKLSADPRERELANPLLLTQGSHDVVWVVDSDGEFARTLPYRTATPRPVVGDAGLVALAWHAQYERFGAPQVSRRLWRQASRPATAQDWQAWLGAKALAAAVVAAPKGPATAVQQALMAGELDGSKGVPMTFRPWDGQLRQPLLLTDGQGVIGTAPVDGVLHPRNHLDTLGADAPEKLCKARPA
ncbi:branched-chain amino acid ABC transporter substrate-binding protein [Ideonella sp. TBM-1]|uniref:Branched-chain amino acid ABC transporter substrate-binding protein n=1 Tax=Ideonella livida TaxID=2707176 RepID=A0A7C9PG35_9BURK|nr:branched-chain amino acid ABC transporter substrate-binding protein [Ideonella livida]